MKFDVPKAIPAFICFALTFQLTLLGQKSSTDTPQGYLELVERAFGQDQELVNGLQYYNRHPRSLGHPYLLEGLVHEGSVTLRGQVYNHIWLKFDIHAQQVEVEYQTMNGADNQVILVGDRVDEFSIGNYYFKRLKLEEDPSPYQFYQVIGGGRMIWYIRWEKKLVPISGDSRFIEEYTAPKRDYLLDLDGTVSAFQNKKSFVKLFPKAVQKDLKRLMKKNHLMIKTAKTEELELFLIAASRLLEEGGIR
jgi:hypothetical protein